MNHFAGLYIHIPFCSNKCLYCDFFSKSESTEEISKYISNLLDQSWNNEKLRNIGIRFSNLTDKRQKQISIFSNNNQEEKTDTVQETMDKINDKYGSSVIRQANLFTK